MRKIIEQGIPRPISVAERRIPFFRLIVFFMLIAVSCYGCAAKQKNLRCNLYVIDVLKTKNIYLPSSSANDIDGYLKKSPLWKKIPKKSDGKLDHLSAYNAAKSAKYVLATYNGGNKNGHVAIVNGKKGMSFSKSYNAYVPYAVGSVRGREPELLPLSYQFSADKEYGMNYFIYQKQ